MNTGTFIHIEIQTISFFQLCSPDRHVVLPKEYVKLIPKTHLMSESEWRALGVKQSKGWIHYMIHEPEPHILLFRRLITPEIDPKAHMDHQ